MSVPRVVVAPSAQKRIRNFDCWVFRDELASPRPSAADGDIVELTDGRGSFLAYAFYNGQASIAARVVSLDKSQPVDRALLAHRLESSIAQRASIRHTNAKRLVFSEADGLPGLIVDQYADVLVLQVRTAGLERWKSAIVEILRQLLHPAGILERSDKEFRNEEGLPPTSGLLTGTVPERTLIEEHGLQFWVDPYEGQKTGFYLDQRDTRRRIRQLIEPGMRVADVFAYTGAFGIAAASCGAEVVCVEQQEPFLALAKEHARLNGVGSRMTFVAGDAFYWLDAKAEAGEQFDWVLLDPPSLAKSKAQVQHGRQALHHLVVNALGLLKPTGSLALSVCTYHLLERVEEIIRIAAAQRGVRLIVRGLSLQATDHPWIIQMPMTRYLMTWVVQRVE